MTDVLGIALVLVVLLFIVFLAMKRFIPAVSCALCAAVPGTWLVLLAAAFWFGYPARLIAGLLIAQSAVGIMYAVQKKIPRDLLIFRLAYYCTATTLAALAAGIPIGTLALGILAALWGVSILAHAYRAMPAVRGILEKVIACCKNW